MVHLKGLLKKELYLLKSNKLRIFIEFILPIILGIVLSGFGGEARLKRVDSENLFDQGYVAGSTKKRIFDGNQFTFNECEMHYQEHKRTWIGLVASGKEGVEFKEKLNILISNVTDEIGFKEFNSEEELIEYAGSKRSDDGTSQNIICVGIIFQKSGYDYGYKILLSKTLLKNYDFTEEIYDDLSL